MLRQDLFPIGKERHLSSFRQQIIRLEVIPKSFLVQPIAQTRINLKAGWVSLIRTASFYAAFFQYLTALIAKSFFFIYNWNFLYYGLQICFSWVPCRREWGVQTCLTQARMWPFCLAALQASLALFAPWPPESTGDFPKSCCSSASLQPASQHRLILSQVQDLAVGFAKKPAGSSGRASLFQKKAHPLMKGKARIALQCLVQFIKSSRVLAELQRDSTSCGFFQISREIL